MAAAGRRGTAERVAEVLREEITEGRRRPGTQLSEENLGESLGVARNTLREAFRILSQDRLVVHRLNRGVFVRELTTDDIVDIYLVRRAVEVEALATLDGPGIDRSRIEPLRRAISDADAAVETGDWARVGTADLALHLAIVDLAQSERLSEVMRRLVAELRLAFQMASNLEELHARYVLRNKMLVKLIEEGDMRHAVMALRNYLDDSLADILTGYESPVQAVKQPKVSAR